MSCPKQIIPGTIETDRLRLRRFTGADLDEYHRLIYGDAMVMRYLPPCAPIAVERVILALENIASHWRRHGFGLWAIETREGILLGHGGLVYLEDTGDVEVAYALGQAHWGCGYATEATRAVLRYGFESLSLPRIVAIARPENTASRHVMEKVGMRYRRPAHHYGLDVVLYDIVRENFHPDGTYYAVR